MYCDEYDQIVMNLVDSAWMQASAEKYEPLTKEQTFIFLSKFITSKYRGEK